MQDEFKPKLQTESAGGNGPGGKTRVGANTPADSGGSKRVCIDGPLTVKELALKMHIPEVKIIKHLFIERREPRTVNQIVELDLARETVLALGHELI